MVNDTLRQKIIDELETFQIPVLDSCFVPEQAAEICKQHFRGNVDDFINDLLAFRLNHGVLEEDPLTQDFLDTYERSTTNKETSGQRRKSQIAGSTPSTKSSFNRSSFSRPAPRIQQKAAAIFSDYGIVGCDSATIENEVVDIEEGSVVDEVESMDDSEVRICHTPPSTIDADTFSPVGVTPSRQFIERQKPGEVVANFGDVNSLDWVIEGKRHFESGLVQRCESVPILDKPYNFMNQSLRSVQKAFDVRVDYMTEQMKTAYPEIGEQTSASASQHQDMVYACGLLYNGDESERSTRLVLDNIMLRGGKSTRNDISIDVSALPEYSLFPGEVVCFGGKMADQNKLVAEKVFAGCLPPSATLVSGTSDRLAVVIASGPFTPADGFGYESLVALLNYVQKHRPHVLILVGPIVPINREDILTLPMTCQELFDHILIRIVDACASTGTQLVIVASAEEATMCSCYPTPPPRVFEKVQPMFVSDPCMLRIGGLLFGITATDVLFHLSSEEMFRTSTTNVGGDRMSRLVRHLLLQQTFYPLHPPPPDISIEVEPFNIYAKMPLLPHVLVVPSVLRYFLKDVGNVLAINPGHLTKGCVGGAFCRLEFDRRKLAHERGDVLRCLRAQVLRI